MAIQTNKLSLSVLCDANSHTGYGHFMRCAHLLKAINFELMSAYPSTKLSLCWYGHIDSQLFSEHLPQHASLIQYEHSENMEQSVRLLTDAVQSLKHPKLRPWLLIDSYLIDRAVLEKLKVFYRLIVIDDFAPHDFVQAEILINFTVSASSYHYRASHQFLGPQYFICDLRLDELREAKLAKRGQRTERDSHSILVAMGGFDRLNIGNRIAMALATRLKESTVTLLSKHGPEQSISVSNFRHLKQCSDMASLYKEADLVISGGGLIKYESAYCGIENVAISQTKEQLEESKAFAARNLCVSLDLAQDWHDNWNSNQFVDALLRLGLIQTKLSDKSNNGGFSETLNQFDQACRTHFSPQSTQKLAKAVLDFLT